MVPDEAPLAPLSKYIYIVMFIEGSYFGPKDPTELFFLLSFTIPDCEITGQPNICYNFQMWRVYLPPLLLLTYVQLICVHSFLFWSPAFFTTAVLPLFSTPYV